MCYLYVPSRFNKISRRLSLYALWNGNKNPGSATITSRSQSLIARGRRKRHQPKRAKQTNARKAHRPSLSSPSEMIAMLKGPENTRTKRKARLNINLLVELTTKLHRIIALPGHRLRTDSSINHSGPALFNPIQSREFAAKKISYARNDPCFFKCELYAHARI